MSGFNLPELQQQPVQVAYTQGLAVGKPCNRIDLCIPQYRPTQAKRNLHKSKDCLGKQNKLESFFQIVWSNPGPGRIPWDSGRGDVAFASVFALVASLAGSVLSKTTFRSLIKTKCPSNGVRYQNKHKNGSQYMKHQSMCHVLEILARC